MMSTAYPMYVVNATNQDKTGSLVSWLALAPDDTAADFTAVAEAACAFGLAGILF